MNNNAHSILVLAIATHGEKLAISDAYCKVYLSGYLEKYTAEKRLLISLRNLELPKALMSYLKNEMRESDLNIVIEKVKQEHLCNVASLAWGVDAWAAALSVPEIVRKHIRNVCFPDISQPLNSNLGLVSDNDDIQIESEKKATLRVIEPPRRVNVLPHQKRKTLNSKLNLVSNNIEISAGSKKKPILKVIGHTRRNKTFLPITSMFVFTFMASQLADGYTSQNEPQLISMQQPTKLQKPPANLPKTTLKPIPVATINTEIALIDPPTPKPISVELDDTKLALTDTPPLKPTPVEIDNTKLALTDTTIKKPVPVEINTTVPAMTVKPPVKSISVAINNTALALTVAPRIRPQQQILPSSANRTAKTQRKKRLKADIEAFLTN